MRVLIRRLATAAVLAPATLATIAAEPGLAFEPFLDCAASQAYYRYLVAAADDGNADELKSLDQQIQFYLQIAESLSQRNLRREFVESSESEAQKAKKMIKAGGSDAYFAYYTGRKNECRRLVREHQSEIMDAADRLYEGQGKH
jgi:hypothetical protein